MLRLLGDDDFEILQATWEAPFGGLGDNGTSIFGPREEFAVHSAGSFKPSEVLALPGNGIHWDMHELRDAQVW